MSITLISAVDLNNGIGYKNNLLTKLPNDMKHFRQHTEGNVCIMGRKTLESIIDQTGHILPNRINVVLTRNKDCKAHKGVFIYRSIDQILKEYKNHGNGLELFVCGGEEIYRQFMPYADRILLTVIHHEFDHVDAYFPEINAREWLITDIVFHVADNNNKYHHEFVTYKRR